MSATLNTAKPIKGSTVAVFGLGTVRLDAAEGARIAGTSRIIGINMNPNRFVDVQEIWCYRVCEPERLQQAIQEGWGVVLVGVPNKDDAFKTNPMNLLNERTLKGTFFGN